MGLNRKYKAVFIVPKGAEKVLGEDGWEFHGANRLSSSIEQSLVDFLNLQFVKEWSEVKKYRGQDIDVSIVFDGDGGVEYIYFQVFDNYSSLVSKLSCADDFSKEAVLFTP